MKTEQEMIDEMYELYKKATKEEKDFFYHTLREKLGIFHFTLGMSIRNRFKLWERTWEEDLKNGIDYSPDHPDAISTRVIEGLWDKLHDEEKEHE